MEYEKRQPDIGKYLSLKSRILRILGQRQSESDLGAGAHLVRLTSYVKGKQELTIKRSKKC